jgi:hypothetical protein
MLHQRRRSPSRTGISSRHQPLNSPSPISPAHHLPTNLAEEPYRRTNTLCHRPTSLLFNSIYHMLVTNRHPRYFHQRVTEQDHRGLLNPLLCLSRKPGTRHTKAQFTSHPSQQALPDLTRRHRMIAKTFGLHQFESHTLAASRVEITKCHSLPFRHWTDFDKVYARTRPLSYGD